MWQKERNFEGYQALILGSHSALQDYLWKSPSFIGQEEEIERVKLHSYFPDRGDEQRRERNRNMRDLRAKLEGAKLFVHFPILVAQANLYLTTAWFEKHLYRLAKFCDHDFGSDVSQTSGNGPTRYFRHLRLADIQCSKFEAFDRLSLAIVYRNALLHASGDLALSRDKQRILQAVEGQLHIEKHRRGDGGMQDEQGRPEVWIAEQKLGVNFYYPMRVARDAFSLLIDISDHLPSALAWRRDKQ